LERGSSLARGNLNASGWSPERQEGRHIGHLWEPIQIVLALERLKVATKIGGRDGVTLASPSLVHEPVSKYKLEMEDEESWSQTSSNLRVNLVLEPCLHAFILTEHAAPCYRYSMLISTEPPPGVPVCSECESWPPSNSPGGIPSGSGAGGCRLWTGPHWKAHH
jgi:hypothetical protein